MQLLTNKTIPIRLYVLTIIRVCIKIAVVVIAIVLGADSAAISVILGIIFVSELYKNIGAKLITKGVSTEIVGTFIGALDGALLIFALYFANALNTELYLFVLFSIALNAAEYGLLSSIIEGLVAGICYTAFLFGNLGTAGFFASGSTYILRVSFLVFLGWVTGWLSTELGNSERNLKVVIEEDIHEGELNEMKNVFVNNAAENLKTPISAIKGYVDLMLKGRVGKLDERITGYLTSISTNILKVDALTAELLNIIEIEGTALKMRKKDTEVSDFVASLEADANAFGKIYHSSISFSGTIPQGETIHIDAIRLKIAIRNILYYLFEQSIGNITVTFVKSLGNLCIQISVKMKDATQLSMLFNSSNDWTKQRSLLGVYTAKLIIDSHGGMIDFTKREEIVDFVICIPYTIKK